MPQYFSLVSPLPSLELQSVSDHCDEFRIGGFSLGITHREPKVLLQGVQVAAIPGHFNGVADGSFHPAGGGAELPGHLGVEDLGDSVDDLHVLHGHDDGLPQVLVALDAPSALGGTRVRSIA